VYRDGVVLVKSLCSVTRTARVKTWGLVGVLLVRKFYIMDFKKMDIGKSGPCMVPGHPKEHKLELKCWSEMRRYLFDHSFEQFLEEVKRKG